MFELFSRKQKTVVSVHYHDLSQDNTTIKIRALAQVFIENHQELRGTITHYRDIKTLVIESKELVEQSIVDNFFEKVKMVMECEGYYDFRVEKKKEKHSLLLHA